MATIGKTFSDPDKWEQGWFLSLTLRQKALYVYLWERCDHAGVIEVVPALWSAHLGESISKDDVHSLVQVVNEDEERIFIKGRKLWFTEYIRFNQQSDPDKPLSPGYPFHRHVWKRIQKHGLVETINERDPILLMDFIDEEAEAFIHPKPTLSLSEDLTKPTGKEPSRKRGLDGDGGESTDSRTDKETSLEFEMRSKGSLHGTPFQ